VTSSDTPLRLPLLAAHLYYRALRIVPGLIRSWIADCRDRQLNSTITAYTSTHFSPAIIRAELAQAKDPVAAADLADENLKIRVAAAVHEVTASYAVDEYELELRLRLPSDWPLHAVEVNDTNRVGVTEDRWRSWVLGVQQILTFRVRRFVKALCGGDPLTNVLGAGREHRRRPRVLQEERRLALRGTVGMRYLLLVSA
jgi:E3 ubiquitin-protein ligase listerin